MSDGNSRGPLTKAGHRTAIGTADVPGKSSLRGGGAAQGTQNLNQEQEQHGTTLNCDVVAVTTSSVPGGNHPAHLAGDEQVTPDVPTIPVDAALPVPPQVPAQPSPSWEDTYQHALNTSILSGRFEDLRIVAFSRRVRSGRAGEPRAMYASSALVERARLSNIPITVGSSMLADKLGAFQSCDTLSMESIGDYPYGDDSDLEEEDDTEEPRPDVYRKR